MEFEPHQWLLIREGEAPSEPRAAKNLRKRAYRGAPLGRSLALPQIKNQRGTYNETILGLE